MEYNLDVFVSGSSLSTTIKKILQRVDSFFLQIVANLSGCGND